MDSHAVASTFCDLLENGLGPYSQLMNSMFNRELCKGYKDARNKRAL